MPTPMGSGGSLPRIRFRHPGWIFFRTKTKNEKSDTMKHFCQVALSFCLAMTGFLAAAQKGQIKQELHEWE